MPNLSNGENLTGQMYSIVANQICMRGFNPSQLNRLFQSCNSLLYGSKSTIERDAFAANVKFMT